LRHFGQDIGAQRLVLQVIEMNLGLMVFNLLPIPPLDGRSFLEFLPEPLAPLRELLTRYGSFIFLGLVMLPGALAFILSPFYYVVELFIQFLVNLSG
jgi:Zn-dependent protease